MEDDSDKNPELSRLRGLGEWMRGVGAVELDLGDVRIKLSPRQPEAPGRAKSAAEVDEERVLTAEQLLAEEEGDAKRAHDSFWRRVTRSSGAPIPEYRAPKERS